VRIIAIPIVACLALASCGGGSSPLSSSTVIPPVEAAGPPVLSGTYAFSLSVNISTGNIFAYAGTFTATPSTTGPAVVTIRGELASAMLTGIPAP
jgi:hypothetical protein